MSGRKTKLELLREHETFKTRLVDDVFGKEGAGGATRVPMEKVMMLLWQFRDDPTVVQFMAQFVAKYSGSREVFSGIEFYLPQLAHMIIHLEHDWDDAILERFALMIAQQSLHFALQFNWILQGAIEDYAPEFANGESNPDYNPVFYKRCIKLLNNIERCVVYGRPRSLELQRLYEKGKISKKEYEVLEQADRRYNAFQLTSAETQDDSLHEFGGPLLYKRSIRRSCLKRKPWKERYFTIEDRMLHCYKNQGGTLVRSMPLEGAIVERDISDAKYPGMFSVSNRNFHYVLRASSAEEKEKWAKQIEEEGKAHGIFPSKQSKEDMDDNSKHQQVMHDLTPSQRTRYSFFRDEREFIREMCDIAERLRFKEPAERKVLAPDMMASLDIPPTVYVPLCYSTDIWRRVEKAIPSDVKVFNTNERCPVIMYFLSKRGEMLNHHRGGMKDVNLDVAEYMHLQFDAREKKENDQMELIEEEEQDADSPNNGETPRKTIEITEEEKQPEGETTKISGTWKDASPEKEEDPNEMSAKSGLSAVWHDQSSVRDTHAPPSPSRHDSAKGNKMVQSFLRDNLVSLPRKLANRMESRRSMRNLSVLDKTSKPLETIPIIEHHSQDEDDVMSVDIDGASVDGVKRSSLIAQGSILTGDLTDGGIDILSIDRATEIVCHGESWAEKSARMLREHESEEAEGVTEVVSLMAKSNDDLRQEVFVMQMIHYYKSVFAQAELPLWLKTYNILSVSKSTGLIEVLTDSTSIHGLKTSPGYPEEGGLRAYFEKTYGKPDSASFLAAQKNFMQSLCAYSLVAYLLGLKDRHNGNIMIDTRGHLIFIDFGFAMGMAPGHEFSFEKAPFKLTSEYIEVMGGSDSECFAEFKRLFVAGFQEARKSSQIALGLVEIMMHKSNYPCFTGFRYGNGIALKKFEKRLMLDVADKNVEKRALRLIKKSTDHFGTWFYDAFQQWSNGYAI